MAEIIEWEYKYVYSFNAFSYANRESVWCLMALGSSLFVEVIPRISNRMGLGLEGGVNCTNLSNVYLEVVNPLNFGEFYPSWWKPFAPHNVDGGVRATPY